MGYDPGFRTGCKLAVIDKNGKYLDSTVIKPFLNGNEEGKLEENSTCRKFRQVQKEGDREVSRVIPYYNLDMILSLL